MPASETVTPDLHSSKRWFTIAKANIWQALHNAAMEKPLAHAVFDTVQRASDEAQAKLALVVVRPACPSYLRLQKHYASFGSLAIIRGTMKPWLAAYGRERLA